MKKQEHWFDDDDFWETMAPMLFSSSITDLAIEQVDDVEKLLGIEKDSDVLDLCCGVGRHSIELAKRGYRVTAVDRTSLYLGELRRATERLRLAVELIQSDMRQFRRPNSYDAVINMFTSFGYFEDQDDDRRVVENVFSSLRQDGKLVMELVGKEILAKIFQPRNWQRWEDGTIMLEEHTVTRNWSWMENTWTVIRPGFYKEFRLSHRVYSASELSTLLFESGFHTVDVYGHLSGIPYDQDAKRLVVVGRK